MVKVHDRKPDDSPSQEETVKDASNEPYLVMIESGVITAHILMTGGSPPSGVRAIGLSVNGMIRAHVDWEEGIP